MGRVAAVAVVRLCSSVEFQTGGKLQPVPESWLDPTREAHIFYALLVVLF